MADFRVTGVIEVDASRAIRNLTRFQKKMASVLTESVALDKALDKLDGKKVKINMDVDKSALDGVNNIQGGDVKVKVDVDSGDALTEMQQLEAELHALIDEDHFDATVSLDTTLALAKADKLNAELKQMERNKHVIKVDVDTKKMDEFDKKVKEVNTGLSGSPSGIGTAGMIGAVVALAAVLGPLGAVSAGVLGGMAGGLVGLGAAVTGYGIIAMPTFKKTGEMVKVMNQALKETDPTKLAELNKKLAELKAKNPALYEVAQGVMKLKKRWEEMSKALQPEVIKAMGYGLGVANTMLGYFNDIAIKAAPAITALMKSMDTGLKGEEWKGFFGYMADNSAWFITTWGKAVGNFVTGIANMIVAFDPLTKFVGNGFLHMSEKFRAWSKTMGESQGFKNFVAFFKANGPMILHLIGQLGLAFVNILVALAPFGVKILETADHLLTMYNNWSKANPEASKFATTAGALALIAVPLAGNLAGLLKPLGGLAKLGWGAITGGLRGMGATGMLAGSGLGAAAGGAVALGLALGGFLVGLALFTHKGKEHKDMMDSLKKAWDDLKSTMKDIWENIIKPLWEKFQNSGAIENTQNAIKNLADAFDALLPVLKPAAAILGGSLLVTLVLMAKYLETVTGAIKFLAEIAGWAVKGIVATFQWLYDTLIGHSIIPDLINGIVSWFTGLGPKLLGVLASLPGAIGGKFLELATNVKGKVGELVNSVKTKFLDLKTSVSTKAGELKTAVSTKWSELSTATSTKFAALKTSATTKFQEIKTSISTKAGEAKQAVVDKFQSMKEGAAEKISAMKQAISDRLSSLPGTLARAGASAIGSFISGLGSRLSDLRSMVSSIASTVAGAFHGSPVKWGPLTAWNHKSPGATMMERLAEGIKQDSTLNSALSKVGRNITVPTLAVSDVVGRSWDSLNRGTGNLAADGGMSSGGGGQVNNYYDVELKVPVGASSVEIGRTLVDHIKAYETLGGRKKK